MEQVYIECKNCGFKGVTNQTDEELEMLDEDEVSESETCPMCNAPVVEIDDQEQIETLEEQRKDNQERRVQNFDLDRED